MINTLLISVRFGIELLLRFPIFDATVKSGFEKGFHIIIPAYANSTYDNPYFDGETAYKYYNEFMWPVRYAQAVTVDEAIAMME